MPVPDVSEDVLELVERRVSDQVQDRVQKRIGRTYATIATVILAAGGFAAYDIAGDVRETAIAAAQKTVQDIVEHQVRPAAELAQSRIGQASEALMQAQLRIGMVDETLQRMVAKTDSAEEKAGETLARAARTLTQTEAELSALRDKVAGLHAETNDQLKTLRDTVADIATLSSLNEDVHSLAKQVGAIDGVVQALVQHATGANVLDKSQLVSLSPVAPIVESIQKRGSQLQNSGRLTVFFQFADMPNELAREISVELRSRRYVVPGEAQENMDRGTREVRYFRDADLKHAQRLAADATAALASMGLRELPINVKPMISWIGVKPRPYTLELWLSVPEHARTLGPMASSN